jgi:RNA polymerase sigma-70 factor (ECF subfamily)
MITFHDLYEKYAPDVYRFAFWLVGNEMEADDITSETFIRAWTGRSKIRTETVKAYLLTIARNLYLEQQRKEKRHTALNPDHADPAPHPEKRVGHRLRLQEAQRAIQALSEIDRTVFLLRVQHELPYAEIARITGLSLSAAKVKVHRARLKLAATQMDAEE